MARLGVSQSVKPVERQHYGMTLLFETELQHLGEGFFIFHNQDVHENASLCTG